VSLTHTLMLHIF